MKFRKQTKRIKPLSPTTLLIVRQSFLGAALFSVIGLIITAVWYTTRLETFTISSVTASGGETISQASVVELVEQELAGSYLGLIPKRFTFFYPEVLVKEKVSQIARIKNVEVALVSNRDLVVTYDEYKPDALWCNEAGSHDCYFLDNQGYAFGIAPKLEGGSLIRYYSLQQELAKGVNPFGEADYKIAKEFTKLLSGIGWYVAKIEIDSARDVFFTLTPGSELKANLTQNPTELFNHLQTVRQSEEFLHLKPGNFQYIDLRFGTKLFVNEEIPLEISPVTASGTATSTDSGQESEE